ncbi:hypothetical protein [Lactobacillus sp.]|uniref:hypothetical protein n=1 Tax=Lactobacillus sp. TaxID=1591 RepID=UPI0019BFF2A2|nr:hypothetical protein [Lactobacillus sp.]MBD5430522.1 hypothetical protein [Lactobacillus sp.]MBD5430813.1 hypothetical protein [Lactobacillus sp.]
MDDKYQNIAVIPVITDKGWKYMNGQVFNIDGLELFVIATDGINYDKSMAIFDLITGSFIIEVPLSEVDFLLMNESGHVTKSTWNVLEQTMHEIVSEFRKWGSKKLHKYRQLDLSSINKKRPPLYYLRRDDPELYDKIREIEAEYNGV